MRVSVQIRRLRSRLPLERLVRAAHARRRRPSAVQGGHWPSTSRIPLHVGWDERLDRGEGDDTR